MRLIRNAFASVALASLAIAQPALAAERTASPIGDAEGIGGLEAALAAFFVIFITLELTDVIEVTDILGGDDEPASP